MKNIIVALFALLSAGAMADSPFPTGCVEHAFYKSQYGTTNSLVGQPCDTVWTAPYSYIPGNPPWSNSEIVSLYEGESITMVFDHDVVDDPRNPFGVDLIVFGADMPIVAQTPDEYGGVSDVINPADAYLRLSQRTPNRCSVEVSCDGEHWYMMDKKVGGYDTPPICAKLLCDPYEFETEQWYEWDGQWYSYAVKGTNFWNGAADFTKPVDPTAFAGFSRSYDILSLKEIAEIYNGSAGGMGYNLSELPDNEFFPLNEDGWHYIKYVRLTPYWDKFDLTYTTEDSQTDRMPYVTASIDDFDEQIAKFHCNIAGISDAAPVNFAFESAKFDGEYLTFECTIPLTASPYTGIVVNLIELNGTVIARLEHEVLECKATYDRMIKVKARSKYPEGKVGFFNLGLHYN